LEEDIIVLKAVEGDCGLMIFDSHQEVVSSEPLSKGLQGGPKPQQTQVTAKPACNKLMLHSSIPSHNQAQTVGVILVPALVLPAATPVLV